MYIYTYMYVCIYIYHYIITVIYICILRYTPLHTNIGFAPVRSSSTPVVRPIPTELSHTNPLLKLMEIWNHGRPRTLRWSLLQLFQELHSDLPLPSFFASRNGGTEANHIRRHLSSCVPRKKNMVMRHCLWNIGGVWTYLNVFFGNLLFPLVGVRLSTSKVEFSEAYCLPIACAHFTT